ncbi:flagellin [Phenylobacterium montanum]|uniref:Flagellin n=1 Tax=Phenylobacterium montanum TaxID=2823693 RepID=A0A975FZM7_9CAUL|nr:flagellin [Caulobacter sp. S6]QUD88101.1 flagellin [Caulobacter sp. S6]
MSFSVNTNAGAMIALEDLSATQQQMSRTQNRVSTGLSVATAKDNGAVWAIAQNERAQISALDSVKSSLNRGSSIVDVALSAGQSVSDLLNQMKAQALSASDTSLDATSRQALSTNFAQLRDQIAKAVQSASFDGANLLNAGAQNLAFLANADGTSALTVQAQSMALGGSIVTVTATASLATATIASAMISVVQASIINVNAALGSLGSSSNQLTAQTTSVLDLQDTLTTGVGNLVDANMAKESAALQALQTKQQLGIQALSIANQAPQILLSLFK